MTGILHNFFGLNPVRNEIFITRSVKMLLYVPASLRGVNG